ncbi:MAG: site-specific integrase [Pseudomonadota bacterium]
MAVIRRGNNLYIYFRPFKDRKIGVRLPDGIGKLEGKRIEAAMTTACRTGNYGLLDPVSQEVCERMFRNQSWEIPPGLNPEPEPKEPEGLTLWKAIRYCLTYPGVAESSNRERHEHAFVHIVKHWGRDFPVEQITIPEIRRYQVTRLRTAAASSVNKERAALSRMFQVLIELGYIDKNPVKMTKGADERDGRREVYVSQDDFNRIVSYLPNWVRPIVQTLYFTGMRRGEALGMTWENVNLGTRIIRLHGHQVKERKPKRIPIHKKLAVILEELAASSRENKVRLISNPVFLTDRGFPPSPDSLRKPWVAATRAAELAPSPTIHDIRHVWKGNAMRSGMDYETREAILGHSRGIAGRYGRISDQDFVKAIDGMRFDEGETEIWIARPQKQIPEVASSGKKGNKKVTRSVLHSIQGEAVND